MNTKLFLIGLVTFLVLRCHAAAQERQRPFIWVQPNDRPAILQKIETQDWAKKSYTDFIVQLDSTVARHQADPHQFLNDLPLNWEKARPGEMPPFYLTYHIEKNGERRNLDNATDEEWANARIIHRYIRLGVDCGIAYFITQDEKYAQCATDVLNAFVQAVSKSTVSDWHWRGGWLYPDDGFREVRDFGEDVPLIYDFIAPFVKNGGKPYDLIQKEKIDFPLAQAQDVFRQYAMISIDYGQTGSNHPVLEAPSLVYNALAMDDPREREELLSYFLTKNTEHQDALNVLASTFKNKGDIWPETSQYLNGVATRLTRLMLIVNRYDPSLHLGRKYPNVMFALPKLDYLVYPNGELIRWGDGKRHGSPEYSSYEDAYLLGKMDSLDNVVNTFGPLIRRAMAEGDYERKGMDAVLFHGVDIPDTISDFTLPRTDNVAHAGIFLQRNLSKTKSPEDALMCFVGGAHMVHGHAEGMNIELYGKGQVLGVDNGRGRYQQDIHENYSRIYAAHNTVIVNGSSRGEGGWVDQGINTVQLIAMEPKPFHDAVSPWHSFTQTSFVDDKGDQAEADQERTLGLIRTSPTTGYYVDVFRSKSKLPNEYHDFLYHNIGDDLKVLNKDLTFQATPDRYRAHANDPWKQNNTYRHPGWHFFEDVQTSVTYAGAVSAYFSVEKLGEPPIYMGLHIPGFDHREYTTVSAPHTFEAPSPYDTMPTPTLLIRKKGEAWEEPFVVVYEPFSGNPEQASVVSVEKLEQTGRYKGLKVQSQVQGESLTQYIITQSKDESYEDKNLGISFKGIYAVITLLGEEQELQTMYIGEGEKLVFKETALRTDSQNKAAYLDLTQE